MTENYDALFNAQVDMGEATKKSAEDYQAGADKGKGGVYQAIIRFVPWYKNPKNSITEKWVSWLVDPITQKGRFVDCPSSVGKQSLLQDMYWKLKKSESIQEQKKADVFSRRHNFASLIQVIKDENQPELEGKIMAYRFGKKLWEKINAEMKPIIGEPHNPFDLLNGKLFQLVITKVAGYNNYDQAKFANKVIPLCLPVEVEGKTTLVPINAQTNKEEVFNFLKENSPDLGKYGFREWDQETYDYVNGVITAVTGQVPASVNLSAINETIQQSNPTPQTEKSSGITSTEISLDNLDEGKSNSDISSIELPDLDLPEIPNTPGIAGNLDDVLKNL
jgi:hypothetical protein